MPMFNPDDRGCMAGMGPGSSGTGPTRGRLQPGPRIEKFHDLVSKMAELCALKWRLITGWTLLMWRKCLDNLQSW